MAKSTRVTFGRFAGGDGSVGNPYQIVDIYGLQGLGSGSGMFSAPTSSNPGAPTYNFVLENNIDASGTKTWRGGNGFQPIGNTVLSQGLGGVFDGAGHTISNLYEHFSDPAAPIVPNDNGNLGLFSVTIAGSEIKNLTLKDIDYQLVSDVNGSSFVGGLVADNSGNITNVTVSGHIGGTDNTTASASLSSVAVGGLVGYNRNGLISYSSAAVDMNLILPETGSAIGGLVGDNEAAIANSFSTGNINIPFQDATLFAGHNGVGVGGFVGYQGGTGLIDECYATGNVTVHDLGLLAQDPGPTPIGGFIGDIEDEDSVSHIADVYYSGVVTEVSPVVDGQVQQNPTVGIFAGLFNSSDTDGVYYRADNNTTVGFVVGGDSASTGSVDGIHSTTGAAGVQTAATMPDLLDGNANWIAATTTAGITAGYPTLVTNTPPPPVGDNTSVTLSLTTSGAITYGDTITFDALVKDLTNTGTIVNGGTVTLNFDNNGVLTALLNTTVDLGSDGHATLTIGVNSSNQLGVNSLNTLVAIYSGADGFVGSASDTAAALTVGAKTLNITPVGGSKVYGDVYVPTFTTSGLVSGTSDSVNNVTFTGEGLAATASVNGGAAYTIGVQGATGSGLDNYKIVNGTANLTVTKAVLTLTASDQTVKLNGSIQTTSDFYTVSGLKNSDQVGTVLATGPTLTSDQSTAHTGTFTNAIAINGTLNGELGANYTLATQKGSLTVNDGRDAVSISLGSNLGSSSTYGQTITLIATLTDLTTGGIVNHGTVTFSQNGTIILSPVTVDGTTNLVTLTLPGLLNASSYNFTAFFDGLDAFVSAETAKPFQLNVAQKALVITAGTATKTYGQTGLTFTGGQQFTASGLVDGTTDSVSGVTVASAGQAATAQVNGGTPYTITASDATGTGLGNYAITYAPGSLTVNKAALTVTAGDATKVYGSTTLNFNGQPFSTSGLLNSDTVTGVTVTSAGQAATAGVNGGAAYALTASAAVGTGLANYDITYTDGTVKVTPAALTLTALSQSVNVGGTVNLAAILGTTYSVAGLQNGDKLSDLLTADPVLSSTNDTSTAGVYADALAVNGTLNSTQGGNYTLTASNTGTLTVSEVAPPTPPISEGNVIVQTVADFNNQVTQATSIDGNANYNSLFGQSDFFLTGESHQYLRVPTSSGEPNGRYDKRDQGRIEGTENFAGIPVIAHASSFTVGQR